MIAYHNDPKLKEALLAEVEKHRLADQIISGTYGDEENGVWRGCAVGCSLRSLGLITGRVISTSDHAAYEREVGVPEVLARLQDGIFEGLPLDDKPWWPGQFWTAIPVGADLSMVWPHFAVPLLTDPEHGVIRFTDARCKIAIKHVAALYQRWIEGEKPSSDEWARAAARAAAGAVWAAEAAAAAARAAARAARAAVSVEAWAAEARARQWQRDTLLRLLAEARVVGESQ